MDFSSNHQAKEKDIYMLSCSESDRHEWFQERGCQDHHPVADNEDGLGRCIGNVQQTVEVILVSG